MVYSAHCMCFRRRDKHTFFVVEESSCFVRYVTTDFDFFFSFYLNILHVLIFNIHTYAAEKSRKFEFAKISLFQ